MRFFEGIRVGAAACTVPLSVMQWMQGSVGSFQAACVLSGVSMWGPYREGPTLSRLIGGQLLWVLSDQIANYTDVEGPPATFLSFGFLFSATVLLDKCIESCRRGRQALSDRSADDPVELREEEGATPERVALEIEEEADFLEDGYVYL